jgi:hypothetical protein
MTDPGFDARKLARVQTIWFILNVGLVVVAALFATLSNATRDDSHMRSMLGGVGMGVLLSSLISGVSRLYAAARAEAEKV